MNTTPFTQLQQSDIIKPYVDKVKFKHLEKASKELEKIFRNWNEQ
jgi:hypothetical protein